VSMELETIEVLLRGQRPLLSAFNVRALFVFGSVARGEARPGSDVDILVEFERGAAIGLLGFARLQGALSRVLGCSVDLVTPGAIHPALRERILREAVRAA